MKTPENLRKALETTRLLIEQQRQAGMLMQELEYTLAIELQLSLAGVDRKVTKITQYITEEFIPRTGAPKWAHFRPLIATRKSWDTSRGKWLLGAKLEDGREIIFQEAVVIYRKPKPVVVEEKAA